MEGKSDFCLPTALTLILYQIEVSPCIRGETGEAPRYSEQALYHMTDANFH